MNQNKQEVLTSLLSNASKSFAQFELLMAVPQDAVAPSIRTQAFMRRLRICFISLHEYLCEKSSLPEDYREKSLEDIADYFISKQVLTADDKEQFVLLGNVYAAIRWSKPGTAHDVAKVMEALPKLYEFLQRVVSYHSSQVPSVQVPPVQVPPVQVPPVQVLPVKEPTDERTT